MMTLGFPEDNISYITDEEATKTHIERLLGDTMRRKVAKNDRVFIYFAGHGQTENLPGGKQEGYIIPVDGDKSDLFSTCISMTSVRQFSDRMAAKHVFYAIDACYSELALMRAGEMDTRDRQYMQKVARFPSRQLVTAGSAGEQVVERGGHGAFTRTLLIALEGSADKYPPFGVLTGSELGNYLKPTVSVETNNAQTPQFGRLSAGEGEFIFLLEDGISELVSEAERAKTVAEAAMREAERLKQEVEAARSYEEASQAKAETERLRKELEALQGETKSKEVDQAKNEEGNSEMALMQMQLETLKRQQWPDKDRLAQEATDRAEQVREQREMEVLKKELDEFQAFGLAKEAGTAAAMDGFLKTYPDGKLKPDAFELLVALEPQAFKEAAESGTVEALDNYLKMYPSGKMRPGAIKMLGWGEVGEMVHVSDYKFYIDKYEVTNAQYAEFVRVTRRASPVISENNKSVWNTWNRRSPPLGYENHPVVGVSWEDANAYCEWADKRLPTKKEWQRACQGKDKREYPWGKYIEKNANLSYSGDGFWRVTAPVGSFPNGASPYGAVDMSGNAWEWTSQKKGIYRFIRGGSWDSGATKCSDRGQYATTHYESHDLGFRCAR